MVRSGTPAGGLFIIFRISFIFCLLVVSHSIASPSAGQQQNGSDQILESLIPIGGNAIAIWEMAFGSSQLSHGQDWIVRFDSNYVLTASQLRRRLQSTDISFDNLSKFALSKSDCTQIAIDFSLEFAKLTSAFDNRSWEIDAIAKQLRQVTESTAAAVLYRMEATAGDRFESSSDKAARLAAFAVVERKDDEALLTKLRNHGLLQSSQLRRRVAAAQISILIDTADSPNALGISTGLNSLSPQTSIQPLPCSGEAL